MAADSDVRELMDIELGRMGPARDVLPPAPFAALAKHGRPRSAVKRVPVTLRVDPTILDAYEAGRPGWQTRMNPALARGFAGIEAPGLGEHRGGGRKIGR